MATGSFTCQAAQASIRGSKFAFFRILMGYSSKTRKIRGISYQHSIISEAGPSVKGNLKKSPRWACDGAKNRL